LTIGPHAYFEPGVWLTSDTGRIAIGGGSFLNLNVMIAAVESVSLGEHCMLANGCLVTDGNHRFDDLDKPVPWQGFTTKGPVTLGDNVWLGANVVVTSGVTIGRRSVIGANSVVIDDVPAFSIAAGAPAKVLKRIEHD
jgi:acetyltransferase-like isoleucine patch superfamily enzyme